MRGISEEKLIEILSNVDKDNYTTHFLEDVLLSACEELGQQWLTPEELLKSGFVGLCFYIKKEDQDESWVCHFDGEHFINPYMPNYPVQNVLKVYPIYKPELSPPQDTKE